MNIRRFSAVILALILVIALVGCGGTKREAIELTLSTEDSAAILAAAGIHLPSVEEAAGANSTVQWFCWMDLFQNYSEDEIVQTGYYTFQLKYGGKVEWIECDYWGRHNELANLMLAGTPPDMTNAGTSNFANFPFNATRGMYQPVDEWIDYENDPLWTGMKDAGDYFVLGGRHFAIVYDLTFKDVVPYNRRVMDEWGFEDPAELYLNDEWTWDVFFEMCMNFNDPDENRFAVDGPYIVNGIVEQSSGHYLLARDEDGKYYSNLDDPVIEAGEALIYELSRNDCFFREGNNLWATNNYPYGHNVKDGYCLFYFCDDEGWKRPVAEMQQVWGDITEGEFMIVPLPRYQNGDGNYYLNAMPKGYHIINSAPNPEGAVLLAMCNRFKIIDPTVVNIDKRQLEEKYLWNEEMLDMWDECNRIALANVRMFQTGNLIGNLDTMYNNFDWGIARWQSSWAQLKEQYSDSFDYYIEELNHKIESYEYAPGEFSGE